MLVECPICKQAMSVDIAGRIDEHGERPGDVCDASGWPVPDWEAPRGFDMGSRREDPNSRVADRRGAQWQADHRDDDDSSRYAGGDEDRPKVDPADVAFHPLGNRRRAFAPYDPEHGGSPMSQTELAGQVDALRGMIESKLGEAVALANALVEISDVGFAISGNADSAKAGELSAVVIGARTLIEEACGALGSATSVCNEWAAALRAT